MTHTTRIMTSVFIHAAQHSACLLEQAAYTAFVLCGHSWAMMRNDDDDVIDIYVYSSCRPAWY